MGLAVVRDLREMREAAGPEEMERDQPVPRRAAC